MNLEFTAHYVASADRGEVAVWMNGDLFLVLPAAYAPTLSAPGAEDDVIRSTIMDLGDRLQELLEDGT